MPLCNNIQKHIWSVAFSPILENYYVRAQVALRDGLGFLTDMFLNGGKSSHQSKNILSFSHNDDNDAGVIYWCICNFSMNKVIDYIH